MSAREADIRVAVIGIGAMGKGLVYQSLITPGVRCVAVSDTDLGRCAAALASLGLAHRAAGGAAELEAVIADGMVAVCRDPLDLAACESVDLVIEASSGVASALGHCIATLEHRKHLVLMNSEVDLTYGPLLSRIARENGVVSTSCGGDQYGVLKELMEDLQLWGFDLVMAGNIKGFLDRYATPESIIPEADKRNLSYQMCTAFTDGSKLNIEMAIVANAFGMAPARPGMHGPALNRVTQVLGAFDLDALWRDRRPVVDYILGAEPGGGVFAIGHCDNAFQRDMLAYYKMGDGPYYLFYRHYHLCHIEAFAAVIAAGREGRAYMTPRYGLKTNVYAYAKKDLSPGDVLDGLGGHALYGLIETVEDDAAAPGIPICLADHITVSAPIAKDQKVLVSAVEPHADRPEFRAFRRALAANPG